MTKPLGTPQNRDHQDSQGTFYGHPIVIRVKDLTWQPPVEEAPVPQEDWVSNLLGEDPHEIESDDSLLVHTAAAPIPMPEPVADLPPTPVVPAAAPSAKNDPLGPTKPSYIHNSSEGRTQRRASLISGQWKNRLALGGMAVSLLFVSVWALSSGGGGEEPPVSEVEQELFVDTGELGPAPTWDGNPAASDPNETITLEPMGSSSVPQMASAPSRDISPSPAMSNPSHQAQLPNISTADELDYAPPAGNYNNPVEGMPANEAPADTYIPQFGPSNKNPDFEAPADDSYSPSYGGAPTEAYVPSFDGGPSQPSSAPSMELNAPRTSQYPSANPNSAERHWMLQEGKLAERNPSGNSLPTSSQLPQIVEGPQYQADLPVVNNQPPQNNMPSMPNQNDVYGYGPYPGSAIPQEANQPRARLGGVERLDMETR